MKKFKFFLFLILMMFCNKVYASDEITNLKVNGENVSCNGYECSVVSSQKTAQITYELSDLVKECTPISGTILSIEDDYSQLLSLTLKDKTVLNYTLKIKAPVKSSDNSLSLLVVNNETIKLMDDIFVYSYNAKYNEKSIKVNGKPNDTHANCNEEEFDFPTDNSSMSINYPVTAENGNVKNYTIILKREVKPDTTLKLLKIKDINLEFDPLILEYDVSVLNNVTNLKIDAVASSSEANVTIENDKDLIEGINNVRIRVKNKDAEDIYIINVNRLKDADTSAAKLKKLSVRGYNIDFDSDILSYDLYYDTIPGSLYIDAKSNDPLGVITIENNKDLSDGSKVLVEVKLENGIVRIYTLNVHIKVIKKENKFLILGLILMLLVTMIILFILQIREKNNSNTTRNNHKIKNSKYTKNNKIKKNKEPDDIEVI